MGASRGCLGAIGGSWGLGAIWGLVTSGGCIGD